MMWDTGFGMGGFGWVFLWVVIMLAVLALIVVGIILLVRGLSGRRADTGAGGLQGAAAPGPSSKNALQILEERYARGDIDREEFLQRRSDLIS